MFHYGLLAILLAIGCKDWAQYYGGSQKASPMFEAHQSKPAWFFLETLWSGLGRLNKEVKDLETNEADALKARQAGGRGKLVFYTSFGSGPNDSLILNDFVWYASSAACFLQLFDGSFNLKEDYKTRFAPMLKWRNKVAAHTAFVVPIPEHKDPWRGDSEPSRAMSVMMTPEWSGDRYEVGGMVVRAGSGSSHNDWRWSLTEAHQGIYAYVTSVVWVEEARASKG